MGWGGAGGARTGRERGAQKHGASYSHTLKDRTLELNTAHTEHHTQISSLLHDTDFKVSALQTHTSQ